MPLPSIAPIPAPAACADREARDRKGDEQDPAEHRADDGPRLGRAARLVLHAELAVGAVGDDRGVLEVDLAGLLEATQRRERIPRIVLGIEG
jgi:hypothetical protein